MTEVAATPQIVPTEAAPEEHPPIYSTAPLGATSHINEKLATLPHLATTPDLSSLGPDPAHIICPACNESITTHLKHKVGEKAQYIPPSFQRLFRRGHGTQLMIDREWRLDVLLLEYLEL
jgi:hypothetical protein